MQFIFDDEQVVRSNKYYQTFEDIPTNIRNFIGNTIDNIYFYNERNGKMYCPKCLNQIKHNYCTNCSRTYQKNNIYRINIYNKEEMDSTRLSFAFFDFQEDDIFLYFVSCDVSNYNGELMFGFKIDYIYKVDEYGLTDIFTHLFYLYKDYGKIKTLPRRSLYLYVDNLDELQKYSFYKYSFIWEMKEYLRTRLVNLYILTFYPIIFKQFEYLVKLKLYALACEATFYFKSKVFKENFGVDKSYLPYLQKINITYDELEALQLVKVKNKRIIDFVAVDLDSSKDIAKYTSLEKVYHYLKSEGVKEFSIFSYAYYFYMCKDLKLNLHDKDVLFPKNFYTTYDSLCKQILIIEDEKNNEIIRRLYNIYKINNYEDDTYKIFPASCVDDLIDESSQMNNCVRTYVGRIVSGESQIYFLREKKNLKKSLVTIEVMDGEVVQARAKNNSDPSAKLTQIINKWAKTITLITSTD